MRIGYPCINRTLGCTNRTFRLASYSAERLLDTIALNLTCLESILAFNHSHGILFFRITSDLIPFASHPVCTTDWPGEFQDQFSAIGRFIRDHRMRISMHPDQFVVLNTKDPGVLERSIDELRYHATVLDLLGLDCTAKIQVHLGGVYGDKTAAIGRFVEVYPTLDPAIRRRLVIENDDRLYSVRDCLAVSAATDVPVLFDFFHHQVNPSSGALPDLLEEIAGTWSLSDGLPMADYSSQAEGMRRGNHAKTLDVDDFLLLLEESRGHDFDLMLEIKDKEQSALTAIRVASVDPRLVASID